MPKKLIYGEETVVIQFKIPASLKAKVQRMSDNDGTANLSEWFRVLFLREWERKRRSRR